jgi:hypothetical protein
MYPIMSGVKHTTKSSSNTGFYSILKFYFIIYLFTSRPWLSLIVEVKLCRIIIHFIFVTLTVKSITKLAGMTQTFVVNAYLCKYFKYAKR